MNRWVEEFENSPFQVTFKELKNKVEEIVMDDIIDEKEITEILRLKKVIKYFSSILLKIDPEFVNKNSLNQINSQLTNSKTSLEHYISYKDLSYLVNANDYFSNSITYVKELYIAPVSKKMMTEIATAHNNAIDEHLKNIKNTHEIYEEAKGLKAEIKKYHEEIFGHVEGIDSIEGSIEKLKKDSEEKYEKINEYYNETLVGEGNTLSTKVEIQEAKKDILRDVGEAEKKLTDASQELKELKEFYIKVFGTESDITTEKKRTGGLINELKLYKELFEDFFERAKEKNSLLNDQIEENLTGSTTLGLAKSFKELKDSFVEPVKRWNYVFGISILAIVILTFLAPGVDKTATFYSQFFSLFPLIIPFLWLATFAAKRRSENNRLKQEYTHKEAVAKTYMDYKKQIHELNIEDEELLKKLLDNAINTVAFNASTTLDKKHGEKTPYHEFLSMVGEKGKEVIIKDKEKK